MTKTNVTFLLDRTGSMSSIKEATIAGFNAYLTTLQEGEGIDFSLIQFDNQGTDKLYVRAAPKTVEPRNDTNFIPRGNTPLIDAAFKTIRAVEESLGGSTDTKVIICIQTDGEENASKEHTWEELRGLIESKTSIGWQFNFMGAGIDAYKQGAKMGVSAANTMAYATDLHNTKRAFAATGHNTMAMASGRASNMAYSLGQKAAAGDHFTKPMPQKPANKPVKDFTL